MNKFFYGFLTAAILLGSAASVSAADYDFYVRNRPFKGGAVISGETVKANLDDLLKSLNYTWNLDGSKLYVYTAAESKKSGLFAAADLRGIFYFHRKYRKNACFLQLFTKNY